MRRALAALLACVAAVQLFLAHRYYGFVAGDDVEVLEEAFRRAIGIPHQPWDIRNLFVPDVIVAPVVYAAHALGVADRRTLIEIASWPFIAMTTVTIVCVFLLARRWSGNALAAFAAASIFALHWIPLGYGSTPYPRTLATACIVIAALIADRRPAMAGILAALAFADRFSEIIFLPPLALYGWTGSVRTGFSRSTDARRKPIRPVLHILIGAIAGIALFVGVWDWITWGTPFRSLIKFAHLTLVAPDFASRVKYQSPLWYAGNVGWWCAPALLILAAIGRRATRWSFILIPLLALSVVRHKELRYVQAVIPFLAIAGGAGFAMLWEQGRRVLAASLLAISLLWNAYGIRTFARKSMPAVMAAQAIDRDPRILDLAVPQGWAFGDMLYFHRPVSLREIGTPPREIPAADAIAIYESDLDDPQLLPALKRRGFIPRRTFRDGPARAVVLFTR